MAQQLCTLVVAGARFGIDVLRVQEVIRHQPTTRVPRAHPVVGGLINLRGQIVTAIDLRRRLGLPATSGGAAVMNVVVRTDEGVVSLLVDEIGDVVEPAGGATQERPPETIPAEYRDLILAVHKLDGALLLHLDVDRLVDLPEQDRAA